MARERRSVTFPGHPGFPEQNPLRQPPLRPGEELAGKYRVDRVIGSGAMGVVLLAWHMELEQSVAIKFLYPEFAADDNGAERFRREARAAARIKNEHVARVLDVGTLKAQGVPYIVMEYLHGRDLARELSERGALPVGEAVRYVLEACEAVAEAHAHGIVHRDLKPANLFLAERSNGERMIKVLDFGISKVTSSSPERMGITDTAVLMGSPAYMSPEQLESSRSVDGRSDIWSLGVIAYELVMGALPFSGDSVPQLVRAVIAGTRKPLTERDALLVELEAIVGRCLRQDRADRFQNIAELRDALARFLRSDAAGADPEASETFVPPRPSAAPDAPAAAMPRPGAEGAWGRTHGGRGSSWQRHGVVLGGLLAVLASGSFWLLRRSEGVVASGPPELAPAASAAAARPKPETAAAPLEPARQPVVAPVAEPPLVAAPPVAPSEPPATAAKVAVGVQPAPSAPVATPRADSAAAPGAPGAGSAPAAAAAPGASGSPRNAGAATSSASAAETLAAGNARAVGPGSNAGGTGASGAGMVGDPRAASGAGGLATSEPGRGPAPDGAAAPAPGDGHFEIPEFGGRK
jgi:serine/threonine-protein kinase